MCSAPGSWTQVIYNKLHNVFNNYDASKRKPDVKIVSVDMMPMDHFPGITYFEKDISQYATMKLILEQFSDEKADIIVCDGSIDGNFSFSYNKIYELSYFSCRYEDDRLLYAQSYLPFRFVYYIERFKNWWEFRYENIYR